MNSVFKDKNLKQTKNRELILKIIHSSKLPISAEDIYKLCVKNLNVNLSTIYRTLNTLEKNKILIKQMRQDGVAYYQENTHNHKHLLICKICDKQIPLDNCPLEDMLKNVAKSTNFEITSHSIELYGICENCQKK